jgi:N-acetylneuraminic acid mutarotase
MKFFFSALALFFLLTSCDETPPLVQGDPVVFTAIAVPDHIARASLASFAIDGKAYVLAGRVTPGYLQNDCWRYDPQDGNWSECDTLPGMRRVNAVAIAAGEYAYAGLGHHTYTGTYNPDSQLRDWWRFSSATGSWTRMADFPSIATNGSVCFVHSGKVYIGFGFDGSTFTRSMWYYDPATDTWTELNPPPLPIRSGAVACSDGVRVFFGTGFNIENLNDWWEYFPSTDSWELRNPIPDKGRCFGVAFSVGGRFFVTTGRYFRGLLDGGHLKADLLEYDAPANRWIDRGRLPGDPRQNATAFVIGTNAYIGFGENETTLLNDLWMFQP